MLLPAGRVFSAAMSSKGCGNAAARIFLCRRSRITIWSRWTILIRMYEDMKPDIVIHLAAVVGGIGANREHPGEFFYKNLMMGVQLIEQGGAAGIREVRSDRNDLCVSEIYAGTVQRRRSLERISGRDERTVRAGQEDASCSVAGLPDGIRF